MHKLIIEDDEGKQVVVPLVRDEITIGRQEGNTIRLTEQNISRRHARFIREGGALFVEDLSSFNGIKVNGARITARTALNDGDQVVVGDYKLGIKAELSKTVSYGQAAPRPAPVAAPTPLVAPPSLAVVAVPPPAAAPPPAPDVPEIEGQPTIPVRTLADQGLLAGGNEMPPARLVAISTPLAGSEFLLDRASLVVGRTPENDVILNHKSISRHHAKIIRDGDQYVVVDLESANGVRVNGEQQERVDLKSGDVIELGHVRLRFVAGNEEFGYQPGMIQIGNLEIPKKVVIGAGAVAALGLILAVIGLTRGSSKPAVTVASHTPEVPADKPAAPPAPPAAAAPAKPTASLATLLASARAAQQAGNWTEADRAVTEALTMDPASSEAATLKATIQRESAAADQLSALKKQLNDDDLPGAQTTFVAIPAGTRAHAEALPLLAAARSKFVTAHVLAAEQLKAKGLCEDLKRESALILAVDDKNRQARDLVAQCKAPAAAKPVVATVRPTPAPEPVVREAKPARPTPAAAAAPTLATRTPQPPPAEDTPAGDPDELLQQAQDAWLKGQFASAIEASKKALRLRPGAARAYQIIAVCSCSLRDQESASKAYDRLDDKNKKLVKALCQKSGVTVD